MHLIVHSHNFVSELTYLGEMGNLQFSEQLSNLGRSTVLQFIHTLTFFSAVRTRNVHHLVQSLNAEEQFLVEAQASVYVESWEHAN